MNPPAQNPPVSCNSCGELVDAHLSNCPYGSQNKVPDVNAQGKLAGSNSPEFEGIKPADSSELRKRILYNIDSLTTGVNLENEIIQIDRLELTEELVTLVQSIITQKETEARLDELERLNFVEASGFLAGGNHVLRQQVVTKRIAELKTQQEKK